MGDVIHDAAVRTTIDISDAVLRELRELAHATRRPFRVVVEDTLQRGLGGAARRSRRARVRIETGPVGVQEGVRGMSMNQLYDQLEAEAGRRKP